MNVSATTIYFWQLADRVLIWVPYVAGWGFFLFLVAIITSVCSGHAAAHYEARVKKDCPDQEEAASCRFTHTYASRFVTGFLSATIAALLGMVFIPTSNTIAMMVVIPEIAKSKVVQTDLPDLYNAAVSALKAAIAPEKK